MRENDEPVPADSYGRLVTPESVRGTAEEPLCVLAHTASADLR